MKNSIEVRNFGFPDLFQLGKPLAIPEYQRPYVWEIEKAIELIEDFKEFFSRKKSSLKNYYLGTILLFDNKTGGKPAYEIIDGQQRITTLLILEHLLQCKYSGGHEITYNSPLSYMHIRAIGDLLKNRKHDLEFIREQDILTRLQFTVIITPSEDEAFTFFDTQNNRGMTLGATDFLKAFHLRVIPDEELQNVYASSWENSEGKFEEESFIAFLFEKVLWRIRNWNGKGIRSFENETLIRATFEKNTLKSVSQQVPLYNNRYNRQVITLDAAADGSVAYNANPLDIHESHSLPFSLRQPINRGTGFFLYMQKYAAVYDILFSDEPSSEEITSVRKLLSAVYNDHMSGYLTELMQLCLIVYYDVFGEQQLYRAALCFDYFIGAIRIVKAQIKKEAVLKCLREYDRNLLDVVAAAYLPEEVFNFIESLEDVNQPYLKEKLTENDGVRMAYKMRVIKFFEKPVTDLSERRSWQK